MVTAEVHMLGDLFCGAEEQARAPCLLSMCCAPLQPWGSACDLEKMSISVWEGK
jgi:hypothetical protein